MNYTRFPRSALPLPPQLKEVEGFLETMSKVETLCADLEEKMPRPGRGIADIKSGTVEGFFKGVKELARAITEMTEHFQRVETNPFLKDYEFHIKACKNWYNRINEGVQNMNKIGRNFL